MCGKLKAGWSGVEVGLVERSVLEGRMERGGGGAGREECAGRC